MPVTGRVSTLLIAAALGLAVPPTVAAAEPAPQAAQPSEYLGAVTLITGDQVTVRRVGDRLLPHVIPAAGRERLHFATAGTGERLLVVPSDATAALNAGHLDERLFDVGALLRDGFDDARRADLPLIVRDTGEPAALTEAGGTMTVSTADTTAMRQPKRSTAELWDSLRRNGVLGTGKVWLDGLRRPSLDVSVPRIGAPTAWQAGYTGQDVPVAVLDTGIDATHPDFRGKLAAVENFTDESGTRDAVGHGTHVASILAGSGAASAGRYTGVAPGARLLIGKVCHGGGCPESAILAGMAWAVRAGAKVVNLSLGGPDTSEEDPLEHAVNRLSAQHGTLFVIATGNSGGRGAETVDSPASADAALAVGAVDRNDALAGFSGRGPRFRDAALKPEIVAPGVEITAARSRFSTIGERRSRYAKLSGTSMATPHLAGAAAILAQQHPDWTGAQLKAALMASATPLDGVGAYEQGAGRVDVARAITQGVYTEPAGVSVGRPAWPHEDDPPTGRTLTYRNTTSAPLTLRLSLPASGPDGAPAPDGMFALSANEITVPAGGQAAVGLTVNTAVPAAEGAFSARIEAATTGTGLRITTPIAVDREPESYDLTLRHLDSHGSPTDNYFSFVWGVDMSRFRPVAGSGGAATVRVRKGRYHVDTVIATPRPDGKTFDSGKIVQPTVDVGADTTVTLDARATRPISVSFARPDVRPQAVAAGYGRFIETRALFTGVLGDTFERIFTAHVGDPLPDQEMVADIGGMWAVPDRHGDVTRSAVTYNLAWFQPGRLPTGFARNIVDAELASVRTTYRAQEDRKRATKLWIAREPALGVSTGFGFGFRLPLARTEFHNVDGLQWFGEFQQWVFEDKVPHTETVLTGAVVDHQPGQSYVEDWNAAVFGPGFAGPTQWAFRSGDLIALNIPMHSDAGLDRYGVSELDAGTTVLYRDGAKLGEASGAGRGQFEVPAEPGAYRLETTARRSGVSDYSTLISCAWMFSSVRPPDEGGGGKGKGGVPLPLMAVRFAPPGLDEDNGTRADSLDVPVAVQRQNGVPAAEVSELTVEASFDDGRTWRTVEVTRGPGDDTAVARVDHPRGVRYASLRATAADADGNTVEQTIIRAYGI